MTICYSSQVTGTGASPNGVLGFGPRLLFVVCVDGVQIMGLARWEATGGIKRLEKGARGAGTQTW